MKKIYLAFLFLFTFSLFTISANAEVVGYENVITDETTIEEDFDVLGLVIDDYYVPEAYDYDKWYVVAMSESYNEDKSIQTYFYFYNPTLYTENYPDDLTITYELNGREYEHSCYIYLDINHEHSLYKLKGFTYEYVKESLIKISNIHSRVYLGEDPSETGTDLFEETDSYSNFTATNSHSLLNDSYPFEIELNFNSMMVLEEFESVSVVVNPSEQTHWAWEFFETEETELWVYFYNFNFPERFKNTDEIIQATFAYDYIEYHETRSKQSLVAGTYSQIDAYTSTIEKKVEPFNDDGDHNYEYELAGKTKTITFPRFYIGNRYSDNQFGDLDLSESKDYFNYDCSIFLDANYSVFTYDDNLLGRDYLYIDGYAIQNIEMLELHFKCDGIYYKTQVVSEPDDPVVIAPTPEPEETLWDKFVEWFKDEFPNSLILCVLVFVGIIVVIMALFYAPGLIVKIITGIGKLIGFVLKLIWNVIKLPFVIIKGIFKK